MSLFGALFSGVSGLQSQSSAMGAIADNVTNVNTTGYKATLVNFKTLVTAVHLATEHEEQEFADFAWESDHPWCTRGRAIHAGFIDP